MTSTTTSQSKHNHVRQQSTTSKPYVPPRFDRRQASDLQYATAELFMSIRSLPPGSREVEQYAPLVALLCKLADSWRSLVAEKRELRGIPRAGQLSPAERAAMRQRKQSSKARSGPTLPKPTVLPPAPAA